MAGDAVSNLVISVKENGAIKTHLFWPNMTILQFKSDSDVTLSLSADHSGVWMDKAPLFIRMFLVSRDSCPSDHELFHKYGDSCITVRPASFICGANQHLSNCSLMAKLTLQTSANKLMKFAQNVSLNKEFSRHYLSSATIINGFLCKHGSLMNWRSAPGELAELARKCITKSGLQYVTLQVTGDGKPVLDLVSSDRASQLKILLDMHATAARVPATEEPVPNSGSANRMLGIFVAVPIISLAVVLSQYF